MSLNSSVAQDRRLWVLRNFDLFKSINESDLEELVRSSRVVNFGRNDHICMSGVQHTHAYLVKEGNVRIVHHHSTGKRLTLGILKPGELIGDIDLFNHELPLGESAEAIGVVQLYAVPVELLKRIILNNPSTTLKLSKMTGDRRTDLVNLIQDVLFLTVPQRLAKLIIRLSQEFPGTTRSERAFVNLKLTHAEMADLVGSNREAVSATLGKWKAAGVVENVKGFFVIKDADALAKIGNI
jgi:CRP/FNR family cyclic AMP-dependent transcriptional regulator